MSLIKTLTPRKELFLSTNQKSSSKEAQAPQKSDSRELARRANLNSYAMRRAKQMCKNFGVDVDL